MIIWHNHLRNWIASRFVFSWISWIYDNNNNCTSNWKSAFFLDIQRRFTEGINKQNTPKKKERRAGKTNTQNILGQKGRKKTEKLCGMSHAVEGGGVSRWRWVWRGGFWGLAWMMIGWEPDRCGWGGRSRVLNTHTKILNIQRKHKVLSLPGSPAIYCSLLCSLIAAGRKDLWYLSLRHRGWISRWLKELCRAARVSSMGWEVWFIGDASFALWELFFGELWGHRWTCQWFQRTGRAEACNVPEVKEGSFGDVVAMG